MNAEGGCGGAVNILQSGEGDCRFETAVRGSVGLKLLCFWVPLRQWDMQG